MGNPRAVAVALMIVSAVAAACALTRPRTSPEAQGGPSLSSDDVRIAAALLELADTRRQDAAAVDEGLASSSPFVRALATRTIGQNAMRSRAAVLRRLTSDPDTAVAADAAFALGLLRDSAAVLVLSASLASPPTVAAAASWSLGELGEPARASIEGVLRTGQPAAGVGASLQAAAKLRPVPSGLIAPYLDHADVSVRRDAAYALSRSRVPASVRPLLAAAARVTDAAVGISTGDASVDYRSYVARGLGKNAAGDSLADTAIAALRKLARDSHPHVRINAIRSLASYGAATRTEVLARLADPDPNARIALAQALGGVAGAPDWTTAWNADTGFTYRRAVLTGAARAGTRLAALDARSETAWQKHRDWRYRSVAAEAAGAASTADVDAIVVPLLRDPDARVRNAAYSAALAWTDSAAAAGKPYARSAIPAALADPDPFVRATLLDALRPRARAAEASVALLGWSGSARDLDNDARLAALRVIATAWAADSASFSPRLRDSLAALASPSDPIERALVRNVSPLRHWSRDGVKARAPSWYADQVRATVVRELAGNPTRATIVTTRGPIEIVFFGADAPLTVANYVSLARRGYYDGLVFHRVVPNFVAQDGDPRGDGGGGPGYAIRDELNRRWYNRGAVGMALSGPDTGGSQYFLTHSPQPHLDGHYTVFGRITAGLAVLDALVQGDRIVRITVR